MKVNPHTESKAKEQKCVLKWDLKTDSAAANLTCRGDSSQSLGAAAAKATESNWPADLSDRDGTCSCKRSER